MRRYFADLLAILSNRYQLCPTARHLAVYLLDLFMDHYDVAVKQLYVIALSCLLLASESRAHTHTYTHTHTHTHTYISACSQAHLVTHTYSRSVAESPCFWSNPLCFSVITLYRAGETHFCC